MARKQKTRAELQKHIDELEGVLAQNKRAPLTFTITFNDVGNLLSATPSFDLKNEQVLTAMKMVLITVSRQVDSLWRDAVRATVAPSVDGDDISQEIQEG